MRRRHGYPMNLTKQLKIRVDNETFEKITRLSEEQETTRSWILRDIIVRKLFETHSL
jgi:predicted DNA-binding protein